MTFPSYRVGIGRQEIYGIAEESGGGGCRTIGVAMLMCVRDGKETCDLRQYISSPLLGVKEFSRAVLGHWGIENGCHWIPRWFTPNRITESGLMATQLPAFCSL